MYLEIGVMQSNIPPAMEPIENLYACSAPRHSNDTSSSLGSSIN